MNEQKMFCWQCQETAGNKGCTVCGVCGKTADVAALQDELVYETKRLSQVTTALRKDGKPVDKDINHLVTVNLFITITNANFDADAIKAAIAKTKTMRGKLATKDTKSTKDMVGVLATTDEDIRSLRELITYGLKGLAAYSKHANALMQDDEDVDAFIQRALAATLDDSLSVNDLIALALETGKFGVAGMALLDKANTSAYGNPEITEVDIGVRANPGILISGHDLRDLEMLLEQTAGAGIDVYTHSEMLPSHYYPAFKKYPHFAGNYGNAWWKQKEEFEKFNGPILMTTNCVVPPAASYKDRLWTTGAAGFPGCRHIDGEYGEQMSAADGNRIRQDRGRVRARTGVRACRESRRGREVGCDQEVRGDGGLRWTPQVPRLLCRVRQGIAEGCGDSHGGMRKVQVQQAGSGRHRRHSARPRCRTVQRLVFASAHRTEAQGGFRP